MWDRLSGLTAGAVGFIKILKSDNTEDKTYVGKDVFVHQSHITPKQSTYRTLKIMNMLSLVFLLMKRILHRQ